MHYDSYKKSKFAGSIWLGMAVFFVVFCSCPVKKYIRLQLYKQTPLTESTSGDRFITHDIKDCSYAERDDQATTAVPVIHKATGPQDIGAYLQLESLSVSLNWYSAKDERSVNIRRGMPVSFAHLPLYLLIRHLQV
jgi:hypothetical protein